jgi:hypothetical protein
VANGIKERYAAKKPTSEGNGAATPSVTADPPPAAGNHSEAPESLPPESLTPEQAQAKLLELRAQVAAIEGKEQPSVSEKPSEPQEKPLDGSTIPDVFGQQEKEHRPRRR